jgi:hypothetical protein
MYGKHRIKKKMCQVDAAMRVGHQATEIPVAVEPPEATGQMTPGHLRGTGALGCEH